MVILCHVMSVKFDLGGGGMFIGHSMSCDDCKQKREQFVHFQANCILQVICV